MEKELINFQVEASRIISLLANDIYDSPLALLRENVQNGFDAILMRRLTDDIFEPQINVNISDSQIIIEDNGIGMTREVVENNYWKAGSSGKNTDVARQAGVVGTFGIGAMANFGICQKLRVETHSIEGNTTIISEVNRDRLSLTEKCVEVECEYDSSRKPGTKIIATLDDAHRINEIDAESYLRQFVQYLGTTVLLNGRKISGYKYYQKKEGNYTEIQFHEQYDSISYDAFVQIENYGGANIYARLENISNGSIKVSGDVVLEQGKYGLFGLRNGFGLSSIPVSSTFCFGGIANLSTLQPTAGRDALSQDSILFVSRLMTSFEARVAKELANLNICDSNGCFLNYVSNKGRYDLAGKIRIQTGTNDFIQLDEVFPTIDEKKVFFYKGDNQIIKNQYTNENTVLLLPSKDNPRRNIQLNIIRQRGIEEASSSPKVEYRYPDSELSYAEFAMTLKLLSILRDDYLLADSKVCFAKISLGAPYIVSCSDGVVEVALDKDSGNVRTVLEIYDRQYDLFESFVKDFARNYLYPQLSPFVPSSTRQGADALFKILQKNKELYVVEKEERGDMEILLKEYMAGDISLQDAIKKVSTVAQLAQTVNSNQVGSVEKELSGVVGDNPLMNIPEKVNHDTNIALPPILIPANETKMKLLVTHADYPQLNGFKCFLALSDRLFTHQRDFFLAPHTTKVIWGMHKIVYIFTHASGSITLYYEIELKSKLPSTMTGGLSIPSTTIVSQNRIFIPIIHELETYFEVERKVLSFYVRYDTIYDSAINKELDADK